MSNEWGLQDIPGFAGIHETPYYESPVHDEALSRLLFIIEQQRKCGVLFGPTGAGKSLLLNRLIRIVRRAQRELAVLDAHGRTDLEMLWELCGEFGLAPQLTDTPFILWRRLLDHLLANRGFELPAVIIVDHADQVADPGSNLLLRLLHLARQSQGLTFIFSMRGRQLSDLPLAIREATDIRVELSWLDQGQTSRFVHSLYDSTEFNTPQFEETAIERLYELSQGSPRVLSQLCDLSLLASASDDRSLVTADMIDLAADDLQFSSHDRPATMWQH